MLTVELLKDVYLRGLPLADQFGRRISDDLLQIKINAARASFQRKYGVRLEPTLIKMGDIPLSSDAARPDWPTYRTDAQPYDPRAFEGDRFASLSLPIGPVKEVLQVALQLPGAKPVTWQPNWVQVMRRGRIIQIYPNGANVNLMPMATTSLGIAALSSGHAIPNAWQIVYTAGYSEGDLNGEFSDVLSALGMLAAIGALIPGSLDKFAAQGIAGLSASVDGLSNSTQMAGGGQNLRFAPLIKAYQDELAAWEKTFQDRAIGLRFGVL